MSDKKQTILRINRPTEPLPIVVRDKIVELIQEGIFVPGDQMPTEPELAAELGVSRGTLREALRLLEEDGFISRKTGKGTYVRISRPSTAANSLERKFTALDLIKSMGFKPSVTSVESRTIMADRVLSNILQVEMHSPLSFIQRVIRADDRAVVFAMNVFPQPPVSADRLNSFKGSITNFLESECGQRVEYGVAKIIPARADGELARKLRINVDSLLLLIEQVEYDGKNIPVLFSREYWVHDMVEFTIFRQRGK